MQAWRGKFLGTGFAHPSPDETALPTRRLYFIRSEPGPKQIKLFTLTFAILGEKFMWQSFLDQV